MMRLNGSDARKIRKFGFIAIFFFGFLCAIGIWTKQMLPIYLFGSISALGLGFVVIPNVLRPFYVAWVKIGFLLGRVMTFFILLITYYIVITPSGVLKRIFGGRPIPLKFDKTVDTYWVTRGEGMQPKERYSKRF